MASTPLLGLSLPTDGTTNWGALVNTSITALIDSAIAGTTTLTADADVTLTATVEAANQARQMILLCTGARSALRTIVAPSSSKVYVVINNTSGGFGVKVAGVGPTAGATVSTGKASIVAWNGSDFVIVASEDVATSTVTGLIKLGSDTVQSTTANAVTTTASRTYALQLNSSGQGVVNVPWSDTTYSAATSTVNGLIKLGSDTVQSTAANAVSSDAARTYSVQVNASGQAVVNVPWAPASFPGGSTAQVQFNNAGAFGGSANFIFDGASISVSGVVVGRGAGGFSTNTAVGSGALSLNTVGTYCVAVGLNALSLNAGTYNTAVGAGALSSNSSGASNTGVGYNALNTNTTGQYNVGVGSNALYNNQVTNNNTAVGWGAQSRMTPVSVGANTAVGFSAMIGSSTAINNTGYANAAFGTSSLYSITNGTQNNGYGNASLYALTTASRCNSFGNNSLAAVTTGSDNIAIGYGAGYSTPAGVVTNAVTTGTTNLYIGNYAYPSGSGETGAIVIGYNTVSKGSSTGFINPNGGGVYQGNNSASWSTTSDARIKQNFVPVTNGLEIINALEPLEFDYILTGKHDIGFKAQQYMTVLPQQVGKHAASEAEKELVGEDEIYGIQRNLDPYFVSAIKKLTEQVKTLQQEIVELKSSKG